LGIVISTSYSYKGGHYWIIDGYRRMTTLAKQKSNNAVVSYTTDYVHCNMGWGIDRDNGWYINGVFDTDNVPLKTRSTKGDEYFYRYNIRMLTNITPK